MEKKPDFSSTKELPDKKECEHKLLHIWSDIKRTITDNKITFTIDTRIFCRECKRPLIVTSMVPVYKPGESVTDVDTKSILLIGEIV